MTNEMTIEPLTVEPLRVEPQNEMETER